MKIDLPYPDKILWPNGRTKSPRWRNKLFQKAYLDGIALAIGVNDRHFAAPTVEFADERTGRFVITIGGDT